MANEELILHKLDSMQQDISGMKLDISALQQDMSGIKETLAMHTDALNTLIEWAQAVAVVVRVPIA